MKITDEIAQHLLDVHFGESWTDAWISLNTKDISFEEATRITPGSVNTIASILYHITFYTRVVEERLRGNAPHINDANGFDMPPLQNDTDWQKLKADNLDAARSLAEVIRTVPDEKLAEPVLPGMSSYYKQLHGVIEHAHYHLGQIVILKNLIRNSA